MNNEQGERNRHDVGHRGRKKIRSEKDGGKTFRRGRTVAI